MTQVNGGRRKKLLDQKDEIMVSTSVTGKRQETSSKPNQNTKLREEYSAGSPGYHLVIGLRAFSPNLGSVDRRVWDHHLSTAQQRVDSEMKMESKRKGKTYAYLIGGRGQRGKEKIGDLLAKDAKHGGLAFKHSLVQ